MTYGNKPPSRPTIRHSLSRSMDCFLDLERSLAKETMPAGPTPAGSIDVQFHAPRVGGARSSRAITDYGRMWSADQRIYMDLSVEDGEQLSVTLVATPESCPLFAGKEGRLRSTDGYFTKHIRFDEDGFCRFTCPNPDGVALMNLRKDLVLSFRSLEHHFSREL